MNTVTLQKDKWAKTVPHKQFYEFILYKITLSKAITRNEIIYKH